MRDCKFSIEFIVLASPVIDSMNSYMYNVYFTLNGTCTQYLNKQQKAYHVFFYL